jgi:hypothetical protein
MNTEKAVGKRYGMETGKISNMHSQHWRSSTGMNKTGLAQRCILTDVHVSKTRNWLCQWIRPCDVACLLVVLHEQTYIIYCAYQCYQVFCQHWLVVVV